MESAIPHEQLEQDHRIRLMGLGGRAVLLAESGRIESPGPYLKVALKKYDGLEQLANDIAIALEYGERESFSLWSEWEWEGAEELVAQQIEERRYPLMFFSVALLEFATGPLPPLTLKGSAQRVLDWFTANASRFERHVSPSPDITLDERREHAIGALRDAARRDHIAEDLDIINWELSPDRVASFTADVYGAAFGSNSIEPLFDRAGAFEYLPSELVGDLSRSGVSGLAPKSFLAEVPEHVRTHYMPLRGDQFGVSLAEYVVRSLCDALKEVPTRPVRLNSSAELLSAIDEALESLGPKGERIVVLGGDWSGVLVELAVQNPEGYEASWRIPEVDRVGEWARYRGHSIVSSRDEGARQLYVVEPGGWGCFVRAQFDGGRDLFVDVAPVTSEQARELLTANPNHFPDEPDEESKLRKLQTQVWIRVGARTGFRVVDPSRARRVVSADE